MNLGAQLYTVRDYTKTIEDFDASMEKIAKIGYKFIQISATGDFPAKDIREVTSKYGLDIILTHTNPKKILENTDTVIEEHKLMGADYVGIGSMPVNYLGQVENINKFISDFTPVAEKLAGAGLKLMYHNHAFEFEVYGGKSIFDRLIEGFSKELLGFIVDVYWVAYAGADPAFWLRKLSGRVDAIHFKDLKIVNNQQRMSEVMEGNLNWGAIFEACAVSGVKWAFVEQDDCYGNNPFVCLKKSFGNLKEAGY